MTKSMRRSEFLKIISGGVVLLATGQPCKASGGHSRRSLRFGILTDTHFSDRPTSGTRHYRDSELKMREAIEAFNRADLDFIIELGDMKDMPASADPAPTLRDLDRIESIFREFDGATYHVLGNHDMDCLTKGEFLAHTTNEGRTTGRSYYSFSVNGYRCIVLDANFNPDGEPYARGNFDWKSATIPASQLEWLGGMLAKHRQQPTLIFIHQMLDSFSTVSRNLCVDNADEVRAILERHKQVRAVFQGHHHPGHCSRHKGIDYITFNGMIEQSFPQHNSYAIVEITPEGDILVEGKVDCPDRELRRGR